MSGVFVLLLAPPGTTGNNTHASVSVPVMFDALAVRFIGEAVGGTPTVTWKAQASIDLGQVTDALSNWFDLPYISPTTDTLSQATRAVTTVSADQVWLAGADVRFFRKLRLVSTLNTNVTYRAELQAAVR